MSNKLLVSAVCLLGVIVMLNTILLVAHHTAVTFPKLVVHETRVFIADNGCKTIEYTTNGSVTFTGPVYGKYGMTCAYDEVELFVDE